MGLYLLSGCNSSVKPSESASHDAVSHLPTTPVAQSYVATQEATFSVSADETQPTSTVVITPLPDASQLTICVWREPDTLFLLGSAHGANDVERTILSLLYDGPVVGQHYHGTAPIVERVSMVVTETKVVSGDYVYGDLSQPYKGDPVMMPQAQIQFRLNPDLVWADGRTVTAGDSVYSFEIWNSPDLSRGIADVTTEKYFALDEKTIQWVGTPGYIPSDCSMHFWVPLPRHAWGRIDNVNTLFTSEESSRLPLGFGPFQVIEWQQGEHLTLERNQYYTGHLEELQAVSKITFVFAGSQDEARAKFEAGECDVLGTGEISLEWLALEIAQFTGESD